MLPNGETIQMHQNGVCFWHGVVAGRYNPAEYILKRFPNGTPMLASGCPDRDRERQETDRAQGIMRPYLDLLAMTGRDHHVVNFQTGAKLVELYMIPEIARTIRVEIDIILPGGFVAISASPKTDSSPPIVLISLETEEGSKRRKGCNFVHRLLHGFGPNQVGKKFNSDQRLLFCP